MCDSANVVRKFGHACWVIEICKCVNFVLVFRLPLRFVLCRGEVYRNFVTHRFFKDIMLYGWFSLMDCIS